MIYPRIFTFIFEITWSRNFYENHDTFYDTKWNLWANISTVSPLCDVYHNPFGIIIGIEGTKELYYFHRILDVKVTFAKLYRKSRQQFSRCARETGHGIGLYFSRNISSRIIRLKRLRVDLYDATHRFTFFRYIYVFEVGLTNINNVLHDVTKGLKYIIKGRYKRSI